MTLDNIIHVSGLHVLLLKLYEYYTECTQYE